MSNKVKIVATSSAGAPAELYINGSQIKCVMDVDLTGLLARDEVSHITVKIAVDDVTYSKDFSDLEAIKEILTKGAFPL